MYCLVRLHTISEIRAEVDLVGSIDCEATNLYYTFWKLLEEISIVKGPFVFWDTINHYVVNPKLERVNKVRRDVYVLPSEQLNNSVKRKRQLEGGFSFKSHEEVFLPSPTEFPDPAPSNDVGVSTKPPGSN
jgi:hypothetical protein